MEKVFSQYNLHWTLLRWVASFLAPRFLLLYIEMEAFLRAQNWVLCCLLLWSMTLFKVGVLALNSWMI